MKEYTIIAGSFSIFNSHRNHYFVNNIQGVLHITPKHITLYSFNKIQNIISIKDYFINNHTEGIIEVVNNKTKEIYIIEYINTDGTINGIIKDIEQGKITTKISEQDIKLHIKNNIEKYINIDSNILSIHDEYSIDVGRIDLLLLDDKGIYHIIELKKKDTNFNTIDQVCRYSDYFTDLGFDTKKYVVGVNNTGKNKEYANKKEVSIIEFSK